MRNFTNDAERKAFFDGARAMLRVFELADPAKHPKMVANKNEQHILALVIQSERDEEELRRQNMRALLDYCCFDIEEAYAFVTGIGSEYKTLRLYADKRHKTMLVQLRAGSMEAVREIVTLLVRSGHRAELEERISAAHYVFDHQRERLLGYLSEASANAEEECSVATAATT